jgi:hypothetical protein
MYTTAKEVHVYIDGAIQNIASNRKQSIHPPFIDMVLNNAVGEYVSSKFPERSKGLDIETTLRRYTDFSILKTSKVAIPNLVTNFSKLGRVKIPSNALKVSNNMSLSYLKPYSTSHIKSENVDTLEILIRDNILSTGGTIHFVYTVPGIINLNRITKVVDIDLSDAIGSIGDVKGIFYLYEYIVDILTNIYKLDVTYDSSTTVEDERLITINFPIHSLMVSAVTSSNIVCTIVHTNVSIAKTSVIDKVRFSPISILSSSEIKATLADYYGSKNLHLNPIGELTSEGFDVYYTDFLPVFITLDYIRKPKLFDIRTGQVPEINITKDFLDYAVKELLLILNSPTYDRVVAETIKNQ